MGTHPIFESDFDCLTEKKIVEFVKMAAAFVDGEIANNEIVMFSKSWCPFCTKAKKALDSVGAKYKVIEIENQKDMRTIGASGLHPRRILRRRGRNGCRCPKWRLEEKNQQRIVHLKGL